MTVKPYDQLLWEEWFFESPANFLGIVDHAVSRGDFPSRKDAFHDYVVRTHKGSPRMCGRLMAYAEAQVPGGSK